MLDVAVRVLSVGEVLWLLQYGLYFFLLLGIYIFGVAPVYAYMGFIQAFKVENLSISLLILLVVFPFIRPAALPTSFFLNMAVALILVPTLVLYTGAGLPHRYALTTAFALILIAVTAKILHLVPLQVARVRRERLLALLFVLSGVVVLAIFLFGGARYLNFNLAAVYDLRREAALNLPGVFAYLTPLVTKVAIPFALVFALRERRWFFAAVLVFLSFLLFGLTAHKSLLFYPVVVLFVYYTAGSRYLVQNFLAALVAILLVSGVDLWFQLHGAGGLSGWFASLFARRAILVPSFLNWYYLDFFASAEKYFWADSKVTFGLIDPPYDLRFVHLIGSEYFNREEMSANTGWIGSGYANAGIWGVLLYSVLIGALFALLDSYTHRHGTRMVIALFALPVFTLLTSTDFLTMLLTHGLFISIFVLAMIKPEPDGYYEGDHP